MDASLINTRLWLQPVSPSDLLPGMEDSQGSVVCLRFELLEVGDTLLSMN